VPDLLMEGIDGIFHLAGVAHAQDVAAIADSVYQRVNVDATTALLEAAARGRVGRFVYLSSVKAAADPGPHCVDESWDAPPVDAYGRSKRLAEAQVLGIAADSGMHACILRPCLVYGPGVKGNLARMIDGVRRRRFPSLPEFGNRRSLVSLEDLSVAIGLAMDRDHAAGRLYIVADGIDYSTRELYLAIRNALGRPAPRMQIPIAALAAAAAVGDGLGWLTRRPPPINPPMLERLRGWACYRAQRIEAELGWRPRQTFHDVVAEMVHRQSGLRPTAAGQPPLPSSSE
jgi:nucleoside-diphosphate-sugar epimerase